MHDARGVVVGERNTSVSERMPLEQQSGDGCRENALHLNAFFRNQRRATSHWFDMKADRGNGWNITPDGGNPELRPVQHLPGPARPDSARCDRP